METIYFGGRILTMHTPEDCPEAIWVKNGKIARTGKLSEITAQAGRTARRVDLQGKCLMPGFIDAHSHISLNGQMSLMADLSDCRSFADVAESMKAYIAANRITTKHIAVGFGYDHNFLEEQAHPGKAVLDTVSTEIPIMILHVSAHMGCVNSAMLKLAGITSQTPDPQGGRYGRIQGTTEPDGYLEEAAMLGCQLAMTKRIKVNISKMLSGLQRNYIINGVTTAQEGAAEQNSMGLLTLASALGKLQIDVVAYPLISKGGAEMMRKKASMVGKYKGHIKIGGYKMILDGSPQGRSAWMSQPYLGGEPDYCGYPWLQDSEAQAYCLQAINENQQILAHCNGDAASEQFLNAYEKALEESSNPNKNALRPVMIHCQTVRNDQLDRMQALKMIPSVFVGHVYYWGDIHMKNFGPERGNHISPVKDALDRGLVVNFHQDAPITKPNVLHSVWAAVNRKSRLGNTIGEDQAVGVYDALKAVTIHAAYAYFEEDSKGSIADGKRADLVILDRCPLDVDPDDIRHIQVLETIKDGKTIYRK